jgi:predicted transcriptional regulator
MAKKKKVSKKRASTKAISPSSMTTAELQAELQRRERNVRRLERRREKLMGDLTEVEQALAAEGALSATGGIRRRPRNEMNLVDSLATVLKGTEMSVTEVTQAVQEAGYMTTAANFRTIVNQALIRENKRFKKVSRGRYTAK